MSGPPPTSLGLEATPRLRGRPAGRPPLGHSLPPTSWSAPSALRRPPSTRMVLSLAALTQEQVPGVFQGPCFPRWVLCLRGRHPSSPDIQGYQASCPGDWLGQASHFPAGPGRSPRGRLSAEQLQASLLRGGAAGAPGPVAAGRAGGAQQPATWVCRWSGWLLLPSLGQQGARRSRALWGHLCPHCGGPGVGGCQLLGSPFELLERFLHLCCLPGPLALAVPVCKVVGEGVWVPALKTKRRDPRSSPCRAKGTARARGRAAGGPLSPRGTVGWGGVQGAPWCLEDFLPAQRSQVALLSAPLPHLPPRWALQDVSAVQGVPDQGGSGRRRPGVMMTRLLNE